MTGAVPCAGCGTLVPFPSQVGLTGFAQHGATLVAAWCLACLARRPEQTEHVARRDHV